MGNYTLGSTFRVTLHGILCGNYVFRDICILVVVLHVAKNIMQCGSLWRSDNSLSYSLGLTKAEFDESDVNGGKQDNFNLNEDAISADICSQFPRNSYSLELYVVSIPMKL